MLLNLTMALLFSTSNAAASSSEPCAEADLECLHRALQDRAIEIDSLGRRLQLQTQKAQTSDELVKVWRDQAMAAYDATKSAMQAMRPTPWFYHPALWVAVGMTIATVVVIAVVYALRPAFPLTL
jgi:hypothetical protein